VPGQCARSEEEREGAGRLTGATPKGRHGRGVVARGGEAGEEAGGSRLDGGCVAQSDTRGDRVGGSPKDGVVAWRRLGVVVEGALQGSVMAQSLGLLFSRWRRKKVSWGIKW
jgi:hypothetical protein